MSETSVSSNASVGFSALKPATRYRWVVMTIIFITYAINYADRTNIGVVLPFITKDFHLSNFEAGALASMFFLGYAVSQIPAGFWFSKFGTRGLVSLSILGFSFFTYLSAERRRRLESSGRASGLGSRKDQHRSVVFLRSIIGFPQKRKLRRQDCTLRRRCSHPSSFRRCAFGLP